MMLGVRGPPSVQEIIECKLRNLFVPLAQLEEATGLSPVKCQFESDKEHKEIE